MDKKDAAAQGAAAAAVAPDEKAHAWLPLLAPDVDGATMKRLAALFDLTAIVRGDIDWLSLEDGGITALGIRGMAAASKRGQQRDAAPVFVAHGTTVQGLGGILSNRQVLGSETLNNVGFWGFAALWTSPDRAGVRKVAKGGLTGERSSWACAAT